MMKKILSGIILILILIIPVLPVDASSIQIKVDGVNIASDVEPEIRNNRTMVPLRVISEHLGAHVNWSDSVITLTKSDIEVRLNIHNDTAIKNGKVVQLDVKAYLKNNRTMVPIRFIAETFDSQVHYKNAVVTVDTEPLVINEQEIKAFQTEAHMTMGSIISQIKLNAYIKDIYNIYVENKGDKVEAPSYYSNHFDMTSPGNYYLQSKHEFIDTNGKSIKHFEVYGLVNTFPDELLKGYPEPLLYDVTENQWYLFNDSALKSINEIIKNASSNGHFEEISNTVW